MIKKYFQRITLFTLLAFLCFVAFAIILISRQPKELKSDILYRLALALATLIAADVVMKHLLKLKTMWLWVLQIFIVLVAVYIWIISE